MRKDKSNSIDPSSKKKKVTRKKASTLSSDELYDYIKTKKIRKKRVKKNDNILEDDFVKMILAGKYKSFSDIDNIVNEKNKEEERVIEEVPEVIEEDNVVEDNIKEDEVITTVIDISDINNIINNNDNDESLDTLDTIIPLEKKSFWKKVVEFFHK